MWDFRILSDTELLELAGDRAFLRGLIYAQSRRVEIVRIGMDEALFLVRGNSAEPYEVDLWIEGGNLKCDCNCPRGDLGEFCKHCVAAAVTLRRAIKDPSVIKEKGWELALSHLMNLPDIREKPPKPPKVVPYILAFALVESDPYYYGYFKPLVPLWAPAHRFPSLKDRPPEEWPRTPEEWRKFLEKHRAEVGAAFDTHFPPWGRFKLLNAPDTAIALARIIHPSRPYQEPLALEKALDALVKLGVPIYSGFPRRGDKPMTVVLDGAKLSLSVDRSKQGVRLGARLRLNGKSFDLSKVDLLSRKPVWVKIGNKWLVRLDDKGMAEWLETLSSPVTIPGDVLREFRELYLPELLTKVGYIEGDAVRCEDVYAEPTPRLYLQEMDDSLGAELRFAYGEHEVLYQPRPPEIVTVEDPEEPWKFYRIHRDAQAERRWHSEATQARYGLKRGSTREPALLLLRSRVDLVDFLLDKVPALAAAGFEIYGEENIKKLRVNRHQPTLSLNISSGIDWFDVRAMVQFGDQAVPLSEIKRALRRKRRYVKLADGTIGRLPEEWLERYKRLLGLATETNEEDGTLRFADFHAAMLEELAEEAGQVEADARFRERLERLRNFEGIAEHPLPKGLRGRLRPYQIAGYNWLHFLHDYGFGGILADDMGLGKTVQTLAFLLSLRESGHSKAADLIVVPRSLLFNWKREVEKFTPGLKVLPYFGPERPDVKVFSDYDLVITTYGVMRVDADKLRKYRFHYIILDESQAIKNPLAKTSRAARRLQSEHRLAMTGTPVENNSFELWAQFAFVMPGLLGSLDYFKEEFVKPIEKQKDEKAAQSLRRMVYPFILRRTKEQVAPELPPRTDRVLYCPMEPAQRRFYLKLRDYYREMILGLIEEEGLDKSRMKILEGLLRLRQASNHPKLVDPAFRGDSGKMEVLLETMETLHSEGHKALIFSQFVQMLKLVRRELDARGIPYAYLDGSTRNRQEQVDRFQNDPGIPFFLISLKAGGLGLNLTAADYVIHIDPWWNPAVERQASDRTHRIGQDKPVFVFKLISSDSIEEKILKLQEQKKELVEKLIATESSFFKELSPEDVRVLFS